MKSLGLPKNTSRRASRSFHPLRSRNGPAQRVRHFDANRFIEAAIY